MIAAQRESDKRVVLPLDDQGFDAARGIDLEKAREVHHRTHAGRCNLVQALDAGVAGLRRGHGDGQFKVRRIIIGIREHDGILARLGQHLKLVRGLAADGARIGLYAAEREIQAGEDARIGVEHDAIADGKRRLIDVERIGVLHDELARAHDAEARPDLVAELGLDLVEVDRQLPVALDFAARDVSDDLLVRRRDTVVALVAVLKTQQVRPVLLPAARLLPQLGRLDRPA